MRIDEDSGYPDDVGAWRGGIRGVGGSGGDGAGEGWDVVGGERLKEQGSIE